MEKKCQISNTLSEMHPVTCEVFPASKYHSHIKVGHGRYLAQLTKS